MVKKIEGRNTIVVFKDESLIDCAPDTGEDWFTDFHTYTDRAIALAGRTMDDVEYAVVETHVIELDPEPVEPE